MSGRSWALAVVLLTAGAAPSPNAGAKAALAVWADGDWRGWWREDAAPSRWSSAHPAMLRALRWRPVGNGMEWTELRLAGSGEGWRTRVIIARLDPRQVRWQLDTAFQQRSGRPSWSIDQAGGEALLAINAGQFKSVPWGWVVLNGQRYLSPGQGPLSVAVAFDSSGRVRWIPGDSLGVARPELGVAFAFQSYPRLLHDGEVPLALQRSGHGVDLTHRDARAAIGVDEEGRILVVLTRFDGAAGVLDFLPFGLTVPEMAAIMGGLGAREAVMLDGGISSQLLLREGDRIRRWAGIRKVPLGLIAVPRGAR